MPEMSGTDFLKTIGEMEEETREFTLDAGNNRHLTVELHEVERKQLFDQLHRLPGGFIDVMMSGADMDLDDVDDPSDVDVDVEGSDILAHLDGDVIDVFEQLFVMSANHPEMTSVDLEQVAPNLSLDTLLEAGGEIIDLSLEQPDEIKRFRGAGSDKSS